MAKVFDPRLRAHMKSPSHSSYAQRSLQKGEATALHVSASELVFLVQGRRVGLLEWQA